MSMSHSNQNQHLSGGIINLQDRYPGHSTSIMDVRARKHPAPLMERKRSFTQGGALRLLPARESYFSLESLFLLTCLTASLLILPLILPPLPPPPFMLLLLPIGILVLLMLLAFMPSNVKDVSYTGV